MTTIQQTVEIPASHRISFEFLAPKEIPAGPAWIELRVIPIVKKQGEAAPKNGGEATPRADRLLGIAAHLGDTSLEEIRAERLAKYLK